MLSVSRSMVTQKQIDYEEWIARQGYSFNTIEAYCRYYHLMKNYLGKESLTQQNLDRFCERHNNNRVVRAYFTSLFKWYKSQDPKYTIDRTIPRNLGRKKTRLPTYITYKECKTLVNGIDRYDLKLLVGLCFFTGLRISEALNLHKSDINFDTRKIRGIGKGNKEFLIKMPKNVCASLKEYLRGKPQDTKVFEFGRSRAYRLIVKYSKAILGKRIGPHALRHSFNTYLLNKGFNIMEIKTLARHESLVSTEVYLHLDNKELERKIDSL